MSSSRLSSLMEYYEEDPHDPFNIYALALELQKDNLPRAVELFQTLVDQHPRYVATYYHYGKALQELGDVQKAKHVFEQGIMVATQQRELKAVRELRSACDELDD